MALNVSDTAIGAGGYGSGFGGGFAAPSYFGGGYGGGFGGIAPFGLFGLIGGLGKDGFGGGHGHCHGDWKGGDDCSRQMAILNAIAQNKDTIVGEGRAALAAIAASKDVSVAGFTALAREVSDTKYDVAKSIADVGMALSGEICSVKDAVKDGVYNLTLQNINNTQAIKDQATAYQIANDRKFDELSREGERNTAVILAKLNQTEIDRLRDELDGQRRRNSDREVEINIQNTAIAAQQQQQQQLVADRHKFDLDRKFDILFSQVAKSNQDIINVGGLMAGVAQSANPVNVKS